MESDPDATWQNLLEADVVPRDLASRWQPPQEVFRGGTLTGK